VRISSITGGQGAEALAFARHKRSSGPFVSGLTPQDGRDDLQHTAAVRAVRQVDLESEASAQTNLYPSYVVAKTRLSSLAQFSRTGRWCAKFASHSAGGAAWTGGSNSCGTTIARGLALGASTPWFAQRGAAHFAKRSYADTKRIKCSRGRGTRAASRCMNSSGLITRCVVPSRQGVLSFSTTCPAALVCNRSSARAGRVM
jgi:hypothetical protein